MSDSVRPHRRQPTRLPRPWDTPGKNTGVGCRVLLQCVKVKSEREVAQSCPTLSDPMDCSLTGSSVHGIFQARVLEWGAIAFSELFTNDSHIPDFLSELHLYPIVCWRSWRWSLVAAFTSVCPKQKSSTSLQTYTSSQVLNLCETSRRQSFEMIISAHSPFLSTLPKFISWVFMPSCSHNPLIRFPIALSLIHSIFHVFY